MLLLVTVMMSVLAQKIAQECCVMQDYYFILTQRHMILILDASLDQILD